jgi:hypothetical protein
MCLGSKTATLEFQIASDRCYSLQLKIGDLASQAANGARRQQIFIVGACRLGYSSSYGVRALVLVRCQRRDQDDGLIAAHRQQRKTNLIFYLVVASQRPRTRRDAEGDRCPRLS